MDPTHGDNLSGIRFPPGMNRPPIIGQVLGTLWESERTSKGHISALEVGRWKRDARQGDLESKRFHRIAEFGSR